MKRKLFLRILMASAALSMATGPVMSTAVPVFAETAEVQTAADGVHYSSSTFNENQKGSITLYKYEENNGRMSEGTGLKDDTASEGRQPIKGVQFKAKKIADIKNITGSDTVGVYYTDVDQEFLNLLDKYHVTLSSKTANSDQGEQTLYTAQAMMDALKELNAKQADDANDTNKSGETAVTDYVDKSATKEFAYTDANGMASIDNLDLGLYLIAETDIKPDAVLNDADNQGQENVNDDNSQNHQDIETKTSPYFVSVPMTNVIDMKTQDGGTTIKAGTAWMYDITTYPKNQTTTITKKIVDPDTKDGKNLEDYEDYSIGDTVKQVIYADAPVNMSLSGTQNGRSDVSAKPYTLYAISDAMEKGLKFDGVTKVIVGDKLSDPKKSTDFDSMKHLQELQADVDYKVIKTPVTINADEDLDQKISSAEVPSGDKTQFAVQLTKSGIDKLNKLTSESQVVVYFDSEVTPDAKIGTVDKNTNQATLTWQHNPGNVYTKKSNETRVFTYEIDATKKSENTKDKFDPSNSKFIIQQTKHDGDGWATKDTTDKTSKNIFIDEKSITTGSDKYKDLVRFVKEADGVYHVYSPNSDNESDAVTEVSPASSGKFFIKGLDAAKYTFTEIQTQDHYSLMRTSFDVDLTAKTQDDTTIMDANGNAIRSDYRSQNALNRQAKNGLIPEHVNGELASAKVSTGATTQASLSLNKDNKGIAEMDIMNDTVVQLRTGGRGVTMFYCIAGAAGALTLAAVFVERKRKQSV